LTNHDHQIAESPNRHISVAISFIVPAYNEEQLLGGTLDAIHAVARQVAHAYEIVVANDASTDTTASIARSHGARVVDCEHRQIARVRNTGARASTGDILIFVDADTIISTAVVRASLSAIDAGAVGGGATVHIEGRQPWWGPAVLFAVVESMRLMRWAAGCYVFCTRAAFEAAGGFDERLFVAEEIALSRALQRVGRVVILREHVVTSGRKMRTHSAWDMVRVLAALLRRGPAVLRSREQLALWYGDRRHEPPR
jgi:glycosyltransferase involved in cell wall biosynthesis